MATFLCFQACIPLANVSSSIIYRFSNDTNLSFAHLELNQLTGVAAVLTFPLPDIDDLEEELQQEE